MGLLTYYTCNGILCDGRTCFIWKLPERDKEALRSRIYYLTNVSKEGSFFSCGSRHIKKELQIFHPSSKQKKNVYPVAGGEKVCRKENKKFSFRAKVPIN